MWAPPLIKSIGEAIVEDEKQSIDNGYNSYENHAGDIAFVKSRRICKFFSPFSKILYVFLL